MGSVNFGGPEEEIQYISNKMGLSIFFEGGTYKGETALSASKLFDKVITVEHSEIMFEIAKSTIGDIKNISMLQGDTRAFLNTVLENNNNILFWLDAHWSGGDTYGKSDECPLIEELKIIFKFKKNYAILIDDARLFTAPPPKPHKIEHWPTIKTIIETLPANWEIIIYEDVIFLFPGQFSLNFRNYFQVKASKKWQESKKETCIMAKLIKLMRIKRC